jgi:hypothetical protein
MSEVYRISADGTRVLVRIDADRYGLVAAGTGDVTFFSSIAEARSGRHWVRPTPEQARRHATALELTTAAMTNLSVSESPRSESRRVYRIPQSVRDEARRGLRWAETRGASEELFSVGRQLAKSESIDIDDVRRIIDVRGTNPVDTLSTGYRREEEGYPNEARVNHALLGGQSGEAWLNKLARTHKLTILASAFAYDPSLIYLAGGSDPDSTLVDSLYSVDENESWQQYVDGAWTSCDEPDNALMIELDPESVQALADWIDGKSGEEAPDDTQDDEPDSSSDLYFELQDVNPLERNLFRLAQNKIDWVEIDRAAELAAGDGLYTPQERSANAQRQQRAAGGRFGSGGKPAPQSQATQLHGAAKAHLPSPLPLVDDVNALIDQYLAGLGGGQATPTAAPVTAAAPDVPTATPAAAPAADSAPAGNTPETTGATPLYLAVVDDTDTTAVLDVIALVPSDATNSDVIAYVRRKGAWVQDDDTLAALRGSTPPPVVQLTDTETIKSVLSQVDASDAGGEQPAQPDAAPVQMDVPAPVTAGGWGGLFGEFGEILPIYGPRGDTVLHSFVAAGVPGIADTPSDREAVNRLQRYWAHGEGAAKIRWGTDGDLTRCHRELTKYLGDERAWGFCQLRHKEATGEYNKD